MVSKKPHQKVQVWIYREEPRGKFQVLLLRTIPERDAFWQPVTGSVEPGETHEQAALREAREETGLELSAADLKALDYSFHFESRRGPVEEHVFALRFDGQDQQIVLDPSEHDEWQWSAPDLATPRLKHPSNQSALEILASKFLS